MGNAGVFVPEARLELIDGEIIDIAPMGNTHATVVRELTAAFIRAALNRAIVSPQCPLVLGETSGFSAELRSAIRHAGSLQTTHSEKGRDR